MILVYLFICEFIIFTLVSLIVFVVTFIVLTSILIRLGTFVNTERYNKIVIILIIPLILNVNPFIIAMITHIIILIIVLK